MKLRHIIGAIAAVGSLAACNSDLDEVYVVPSEPITLGGASSDIVLTPDAPNALVLTVYWSGDGRLATSDTLVQAPVNAAEETLQLSADPGFASTLDIALDKGQRHRQFLNDELNSLLGRLGFVTEQSAPLYIRVRSALAPNVAPTYSSVLTVNVQTYRIHLDLATVLDKDRNATSMTLASPEENGIYQGFMGVGSWYNWWLLENNNLVWGNLGENGKTFYASSDESSWNFWFPEPSGCYYTTVNTVEGWWSALYIANLTVGGDLSGEMTYNRQTNQWSLPVNLPQAATISVTISGQGSLYDTTTGDGGPAIERNVAFAGASDLLTFGETPAAVSVALPAGETNLVLDLSNPMKWTLAAGEAAEEPQIDTHLYFSGLVNWDGFDDYLTLYDEATLSYGGAHWVDSEWGYRVYTEPDWGAAYKGADDAQPFSGSLVKAESDGNVPAPEKGLYILDFSMSALSYQLTPVAKVAFTGLNDYWGLTEMTQDAENPEIFTAEFVKEKETPWGVKIVINDDWGLFFGGGSGTLKLGHSDATQGFDGDNDLEIGATYTLTVDLGKQTYTYLPR